MKELGQEVPGRAPAFALAFTARLGGRRERLGETGHMVQPTRREGLANDFHLSSDSTPRGRAARKASA
jgi:hypothetical protein